jgi:hypothetical protein
MSSNLQLITLYGMELSKATIEVQADNLIVNVIDGFQSALETDIKLKFIEETVKSARSKINTLAMNEANTGIQSFEGCKVTQKKGGQILDYEQDPEYAKIKKELDARKSLLDTAFKTDGHLVINDGELVPKVPVKTFIKDSISYSFRK